MMSPSTFTCRWGILGTGWMSDKFVSDLLYDRSVRGAVDVAHEIAAVGSRSVESAQRFVDEAWKQKGLTEGKDKIKLYGVYAELFRDQDIDCVYIASPHSHHFSHAHAALSAGKNVLLEKSATVNAKQLQILVDLAREKKLFLAEALWTRCLPYAAKLREILESGVIGQIRGVSVEMCADSSDTWSKDPKNRMANPNLAGGSLLDLGPYPYTQLALTLQPPSKASLEPLPVPKVVASATKTPAGTDASITAALQFTQPDGRVVQGVMQCAIDRYTPVDRCGVIQGSLGYITISSPANRPSAITVEHFGAGHPYWHAGLEHETTTHGFDYPQGFWGFAYEADEVARCLRDGKTESDLLPLRESLLMIQVFDEIRRQNDLVYPEAIETTSP
ncbi:hypothetical protein JCM10908_003166 [Rhodotorula pacifica]|uniref:Gfo/Idh/MocA family protein n=1 Tax=Rhodotorula pacifica TaxID=1495444 RepID=UPI0031801AA6